MAWMLEHWLAIGLLAAYTLMLLYNAYVGRRVSTNLAGYYVGGRQLGGVAIGISFFATFASTNSYIGHAGKGYAFGLPWLVMAASLVFFTWASWRWVGPGIRRFASQWDALTLADFLSSRFPGKGSGSLQTLAALVIVFSSILYLIAIFKGAGHLFQQFLGVPYAVAVGITLLIVVLYTSIGGFVSVVRTDVVQGVLMLLGSVTIFYFVTRAAGGVSAITELAERPETSFLFTLDAGIPFLVLMGISLSGSLKLLVDPRQLSRFFALRDDAALKKGIWVAIIGLLVIQFSLFPVGIYAHLILDGVSDTDLIVPSLVADPAVFPVWAADFLIVAIMAAAMSSMDSVLLVAASSLYKNLLQGRRRQAALPTRQILWTRLAVVGFAVAAAGLALNPPGDIVEITIFSGSLYAVCFFPAVILGLHWQRGSSAAVLASMICGTVVLVTWLASGLNQHLHEVFPALATSMLVYVVVAGLTTPATPATAGKPNA